MTSCAMIAGMFPLALGLGEGGDQTEPLGRAVVGGLAAATFATLTVLPGVFAILATKRLRSPSLDPEDPASAHYTVRRRSTARSPPDEADMTRVRLDHLGVVAGASWARFELERTVGAPLSAPLPTDATSP